MRISDLFEMTMTDAIQAFRNHGVEPTGLSPDQLKIEYRKLAKKFHPDVNSGDKTAEQKLKTVNAAYDVLKAGVGAPEQPRRPDSGRRYAHNPASREDTPWAWAGYSGGLPPNANISSEDYRDGNYIKKRMWELNGGGGEEWTISGFDGSFFRHEITVYGSPKIFREMAKAMVFWQTKGANAYPCRAVFVARRGAKDKKLYLIFADGKFYDEPIEFEHRSFNANASNDMSFVYGLPRKLDALKGDLEGPDAI